MLDPKNWARKFFRVRNAKQRLQLGLDSMGLTARETARETSIVRE